MPQSVGGKSAYRRFENPAPLESSEKIQLLAEYFSHYSDMADANLAALNTNLPREAFASVLDEIGALLVRASRSAATEPGPVRDFLEANPLPSVLRGRLPNDFRAFCLALNGLKQWLSAEQAYTDRYLLGGRARDYCRQAATHCIVTGNSFNGQATELHHPARDGRPPLLLSKEGHSVVHNQVKTGSTSLQVYGATTREGSGPREVLLKLKRRGNRSWIQLRVGCESHLGLKLSACKGQNVIASSRSFAKQAAELTRMSYGQILNWLDEEALGIFVS